MAITYGPLPLSTTPLAIIAQTSCREILVYESRAVASWPTVGLARQMPDTSGAPEVFEPGQQIVFRPFQWFHPVGELFSPGQVVGYVSTLTGTTTGIQVEQ